MYQINQQIIKTITIASIFTASGGFAPIVYAQPPRTIFAQTSVNDFYNRAVEQHQRGNYLEAIENYTNALKLAPNDADIYFNRGAARKEIGENTQALEDLKRSAKLYQQQGNNNDHENVQKLIQQLQQSSF